MIFQFVLMGSMISAIVLHTNTDPAIMFSYMKFFPFIMILFGGVYFGWFWSVAIGLQKRVPGNVKMKIKKFKIFFFIPLTYILLILIFMSTVLSGMLENRTETDSI